MVGQISASVVRRVMKHPAGGGSSAELETGRGIHSCLA